MGLGIWAELSWVLCFELCQRAAIKVLAQGLLQSCDQDVGWGCSHYKTQLQQICFHTHLHSSLPGSLLCGLLRWEPVFLVIGWRPPSVLFPHRPLQHSTFFIKASKTGRRESISRMEVKVFIILKVNSHHFLNVQSTFKGKELQKGIYNKRWESLHVRRCPTYL